MSSLSMYVMLLLFYPTSASYYVEKQSFPTSGTQEANIEVASFVSLRYDIQICF
jgi:hypothetical protein